MTRSAASSLTSKRYGLDPAEAEVWWKRVDYWPTAAQADILYDPHRFKLVAGGERAGKSKTSEAYGLAQILDTDLLWIVAADYNLTRAEFVYLHDDLRKLGLVERVSLPTNVFQPATMWLATGGRVRTLTANDESKIGMEAPDGIIVAEAAQLDYSRYLRLRGRLAEKRGWMLLEGTFESSYDWYSDLWEKWRVGTDSEKSYSLPSWSNTAIFPGGWDDPEMAALRAVLGEARFSERHAGIPVPAKTLVFPEYTTPTHTGHYPYNPSRPVELAIDPGYAGAYAVLALQWTNSDVYVVDEVYETGKGARQVIAICKKRPWWGSVTGGVIDIAGKAHHGMESHVEVWAAEARIPLRSRYIPIEDGIERLRTFLLNPATGVTRLSYNLETTPRSQAEFRRYKYPEDKEGHPVREKPIDRDNHSIKAITYWLVDRYGWARRRIRRSLPAVWGTKNDYKRASSPRRLPQPPAASRKHRGVRTAVAYRVRASGRNHR